MSETVNIVNVDDAGFIKGFNNEITDEILEARQLKSEENAVKVAFAFNKVKPGSIFKIVELSYR